MLWAIVLLSGLIESGYAAINLAYGKPTNQISVYENLEDSLAVDGDRTSCSQIDYADSSDNRGWWLVDLKLRYHIGSVDIETSEFASPLSNFTITVWEVDPGPLIGQENAVYCTCFNHPGALPESEKVKMSCSPDCIGRFVAIIDLEELSSICEVYVYGEFEPMDEIANTVYKLNKNRRATPPNSNFTIKTTLSMITCARLCREAQNCLGFNYKTSSQVENCHMYGKSIHPDHVQVDDNWIWAAMKKLN